MLIVIFVPKERNNVHTTDYSTLTVIQGGGYRCLSFSYHMFGSSMGTLNVYSMELGEKLELLWRRSGDHRNIWHREQIDLIPKSLFQVGGIFP